MTSMKNVMTLGLVTILAVSTAQGASTWIGTGGTSDWSDGGNWSGGTPSSGATTELVFDGVTDLTPNQDIDDQFRFNTLTFNSGAGAFALDGIVNISGTDGHNRLEFDGTSPTITMNGANDVRIRGSVVAQNGNNTINVTGAGSLQIPWITGGTLQTVVKEGPGKLIIYEDADTQYYASIQSNVAPRLQVDDGTVEIGTRSDRFVLDSGDPTVWEADSTQLKTNYSLLIGDGSGAEKSAIVRIVDGTGVGSGLEIKNDGWLDLNDQQNYDGNNFSSDVLNHAGVLSIGSGSLLVRDTNPTPDTVNLIGNALIEGTDDDSIWMYDGSTWTVDTTETRAMITSNTRMVGSTDGPTFNVADKPGDTVDLEITGIMGAGFGTGGALKKDGAGTMLINDYNYSTGVQNVNAGTLLVNGTANGTSGTWEINNGGTLGGTGSVTDLVTVNSGGTIAPGTSAGELTIEDLVLDSGSFLEFELGDPSGLGTWDTLVVTNDLTLDGTLNISALIDFGEGTYEIITSGNPLTDLGLVLGDMPDGFLGEISIVGGNTVQLEVTAGSSIPEPSSAILLLLGGCFLSACSQRSRKWARASGSTP